MLVYYKCNCLIWITDWVSVTLTPYVYSMEINDRPATLDVSSSCSHMVSSWVETCSCVCACVCKRDIVSAVSAICCNHRPGWLKYALRSPNHSWWHTQHTFLITSPQLDYRPGSVFVLIDLFWWFELVSLRVWFQHTVCFCLTCSCTLILFLCPWA